MKEIKLFDYQEDMKERIEKALRLHRSVMAQMPTGTGKTVLLASVVESFLREHSNCNVWIVAHRRELVSQIRETIQRVFAKTPSLLYKDFSNHPVNSSKITPSLFTLKEGSTSHPDPLSSGAREETALLGARNRYALRLADHQRSRQIVRDGTALLILACELVMAWGLLACGLVMGWGLLACGLLMELAIDLLILACGLLMGLLLYKYW